MIQMVEGFRRVSGVAQYAILYRDDTLPGDRLLELRVTQPMCNLLNGRLDQEGIQMHCKELLERYGEVLLDAYETDRLVREEGKLPIVYVESGDVSALVAAARLGR